MKHFPIARDPIIFFFDWLLALFCLIVRLHLSLLSQMVYLFTHLYGVNPVARSAWLPTNCVQGTACKHVRKWDRHARSRLHEVHFCRHKKRRNYLTTQQNFNIYVSLSDLYRENLFINLKSPFITGYLLYDTTRTNGPYYLLISNEPLIFTDASWTIVIYLNY